MSRPWIDVSVTLRSGMVHWPGDREVLVTRQLDMDRGATCNVTHLSMVAHTGTHLDAPLHFLRNGRGLETMPIEATIGPARVIEISDRESIKPKTLEPYRIRRGERILFKTRNSQRSWKTDRFDEDFVYISQAAAQFLVDRQIRTVGVDYLSVGGFKKDGRETHLILLGAGIWVIEGLNLQPVNPGRFDLVCLPLKVHNSDGAPARVVLRPRR